MQHLVFFQRSDFYTVADRQRFYSVWQKLWDSRRSRREGGAKHHSPKQQALLSKEQGKKNHKENGTLPSRRAASASLQWWAGVACRVQWAAEQQLRVPQTEKATPCLQLIQNSFAVPPQQETASLGLPFKVPPCRWPALLQGASVPGMGVPGNTTRDSQGCGLSICIHPLF